MTDCEFVNIRYSGKAAEFLRGFRAVYIGVIMNTIVIAWVNLAMVKILQVIFPDLMFLGLEGIRIGGFYFSAHLLTVGAIMLFVAHHNAVQPFARGAGWPATKHQAQRISIHQGQIGSIGCPCH